MNIYNTVGIFLPQHAVNQNREILNRKIGEVVVVLEGANTNVPQGAYRLLSEPEATVPPLQPGCTFWAHKGVIHSGESATIISGSPWDQEKASAT